VYLWKLTAKSLEVNTWKSLEENRKKIVEWQNQIKDLPRDFVLSAPGTDFFASPFFFAHGITI
jgi:hypothetical protein